VHHARRFLAPLTLAPWGHGSVPSDPYVCLGMGSTYGIDVAGPCPPSELVGELGIRHAGPVATTRPGVRNQSVVVVPSLPWRAPRWSSIN
jgi:hypothetical protein